MKLATIKELASFLRMKESTLYSWAATGLIPVIKLNGLLRFDMEEIHAWIEKSRASRNNTTVNIMNIKKNGRVKNVDAIIKKAIEDVR